MKNIHILCAMRSRETALALRRELEGSAHIDVEIAPTGDSAYVHICRFGADILVADATTNEMLPWIRKAAAIITEEASQDCHTATVGLALEKPVIIAAVDASRRLQDGVRVSVDCSRGVVQTMPN